VTRDTRANRRQVWDVVADGWTYSQWVVGNSRMRAVAADWPTEGTTIRHSIGVWPAVINDETVVERCRPHEEVVLLAKLGPFAAARIMLRCRTRARAVASSCTKSRCADRWLPCRNRSHWLRCDRATGNASGVWRRGQNAEHPKTRADRFGGANAPTPR
jgi:hypothetical protein